MSDTRRIGCIRNAFLWDFFSIFITYTSWTVQECGTYTTVMIAEKVTSLKMLNYRNKDQWNVREDAKAPYGKPVERSHSLKTVNKPKRN